MHIRIFEGIATSGKSTVIAGLAERLADRTVAIYTEEDTHIPIQTERKELHLQFFSDLVDRAVSGGAEIIFFDRLYMTQAFRAGVGRNCWICSAGM
jgi:thymidylate kinase